jgi:hypothetical protein
VLAPIPPQALTSLRQLADKMEKILLVALENFGSTFVEPKVELGARFGHLIRKSAPWYLLTNRSLFCLSSVLGHLPSHPGVVICSHKPQAVV